MLRHSLLTNRLNQLAQLQRVAILELARREEARIQQADARAQHRDLQALRHERVEQLLQRNVVDLEAVPDLVDLDLAVWSLVRALGGSDRLGEAKEWQRQVDESVLVLLDICLAVEDLVKLENDQAGHERCRRGNGWDNLARNELGLVAVRWLDTVVLRTQVAGSGDKVDVVVGVVILLELDWSQLNANG